MKLLSQSKNTARLRNERPNRSSYCNHNIACAERLIDLWVNDCDSKCTLSGIRMKHEHNSDWRGSLERPNPLLGYVDSNVTFVCLEFNGSSQMTIEKVNYVKSFARPFTCRVFSLPPFKFRRLPRGSFSNKREKDFAYNNSVLGFLRNRYKGAKGSAKRRNLLFTLTIDDIFEQVVLQNGCCFYSGLPLFFKENVDWKASIERLDESKGYFLSNIVIVCHEFNTGHTQWSREKIRFLRTFPPIHSEQTVLGKRERED